MSPSILTGKPSRALEWVELFPFRFISPDTRSPLDGRSGTLRCSEVPHPDTLNEAGHMWPQRRVMNLDYLAPDPVYGIWHIPCASPEGQRYRAAPLRPFVQAQLSLITTPLLVEKQQSTATKHVSIAPVPGHASGRTLGLILGILPEVYSNEPPSRRTSNSRCDPPLRGRRSKSRW